MRLNMNKKQPGLAAGCCAHVCVYKVNMGWAVQVVGRKTMRATSETRQKGVGTADLAAADQWKCNVAAWQYICVYVYH